MEKKKLIKAYEALELLEKANLPISEEQKNMVKEMEDKYMKSVVEPQVEKLLSSLFEGINSSFVFSGDNSQGGNVRFTVERLVKKDNSNEIEPKVQDDNDDEITIDDLFDNTEKDDYSDEDEDNQTHENKYRKGLVVEEMCDIDWNKDFSTKKINNLVLRVFRAMEHNNQLDVLAPYIISVGKHPNRTIVKQGVFRLPNILIKNSPSDIISRNSEKIRWFTNPFTIKGETYFLSTQWRNKGETNLQLNEFIKMLEDLFPGYYTIREEGGIITLYINKEASIQKEVKPDQVLIDKKLDLSLCHAGTTIPIPAHPILQEIYGDKLARGKRVDVALILNGEEFRVPLYNKDVAERSGNTIQFIWNKNSAIGRKLQTLCRKSYELILDKEKQCDKTEDLEERKRIKKDCLDKIEDRIIVKTTTRPDRFLMEIVKLEPKSEQESTKPDEEPDSSNSLEFYKSQFAHLHVANSHGHQAPHKPLLLLSIMILVKTGIIKDQKIEITDILQKVFDSLASRMVSKDIKFNSNICMPYFHMRNEAFWNLEQLDESKVISKNPSYTINWLKKYFKEATIDKALLYYMQQDESSRELEETLMSKYFAN